MKKLLPLFILLLSSCPAYVYAQSTNVTNSISGYFDTLYVNAKDFTPLANNTYVFVTAVDNDGGLTLKGWEALGLHGRRFSPNPAITPIRGHRSGVQFGVNSMFADVVVNKKGIKEIKKTLAKNGHRFVMFAPTTIKGNFAYRVCTGNSRPGPLPAGEVETMAIRERAAETSIFLNPSPPKQFY